MAQTTKSQTIKCKAAICWEKDVPMRVEEIEVEPPKGNEVRIKMLCASLCHTDIMTWKYGFPVPLFPRVIGHEGVGVIESIGEDVKELKVGDVVIPTYLGECKECENCMSQKTNLCIKHQFPLTCLMQDGTSRMSIRGQKLYHHFSCSTWSQYTVVDSNYVVKIDPRLSVEHASFLSCGFSTGFGAVWKEAKVEKGSSVAVLGLGAVGLGAIAAAKILGAAQIIGIDKNGSKQEKGEAFGLTHFVNPGESEKPVSELVKDLTEGLGVHCCIECSGAPNVINEAVAATKMGQGTMIMVSPGTNPILDLNVATLSMGRTIKGTLFGGIKVQSDLPFIVDKCISKEIELDEILTHEVGLEDINKGLEIVKQPDCVKVIIRMDHDNTC